MVGSQKQWKSEKKLREKGVTTVHSSVAFVHKIMLFMARKQNKISHLQGFCYIHFPWWVVSVASKENASRLSQMTYAAPVSNVIFLLTDWSIVFWSDPLHQNTNTFLLHALPSCIQQVTLSQLHRPLLAWGQRTVNERQCRHFVGGHRKDFLLSQSLKLLQRSHGSMSLPWAQHHHRSLRSRLSKSLRVVMELI